MLALPDFIALLQASGVPFSAALVVWFVWRSDTRETAMISRMKSLEDRYSKSLEGTVGDCKREIAKNTAVIERFENTLERLIPHRT